MENSGDRELGPDLSLLQKAMVQLATIVGTVVAISLFGINGTYTPLIAIAPAFVLLAVFYVAQRAKAKEDQ